ncbi:MAG: signal peptidase II [Verrucomicrobiales bacterium]|nr:signal peptidase II [Verrucomicrobiales bacterium]
MKLLLYLTLPLYLLDQVTKAWILNRFPDYPSRDFIEVIPDFFNLVRVHNTGMAFGMFNGNPYANWIFGGIGILAITGIITLWKKNAFPDQISRVAAALLISGILGNFTDRVLPGRGYVVDFLDFRPPFYGMLVPSSGGHFPSFNVADSCICIAAALLIVSAFRQPKEA